MHFTYIHNAHTAIHVTFMTYLYTLHTFVIHVMHFTYINNTCATLDVTFMTYNTLHIHLQYIQCILRTFIIHALHLQHMQCILRTFIITCTSFAIHTMYSTCTHCKSWDIHDIYYTLHTFVMHALHFAYV